MNTITLNDQVLNTVMINLASTLVRTREVTPKQAMALGVVFSDNLDRLMNTGNRWMDRMEADMEEITIDGESVESFDFIAALAKSKFIYSMGGLLIAGEELMRILDTVKTSYAPLVASEGVVVRRRNYASIKTSPLFIEAVHALEESEFMRSDVMN